MKDLMLSHREELWGMVEQENQRQLAKWGIQNRDPFEWLAYMTEELGETSEAISEWMYRGGSAEHVAREAIQTATLALKIAEMFSRGQP